MSHAKSRISGPSIAVYLRNEKPHDDYKPTTYYGHKERISRLSDSSADGVEISFFAYIVVLKASHYQRRATKRSIDSSQEIGHGRGVTEALITPMGSQVKPEQIEGYALRQESDSEWGILRGLSFSRQYDVQRDSPIEDSCLGRHAKPAGGNQHGPVDAFSSLSFWSIAMPATSHRSRNARGARRGRRAGRWGAVGLPSNVSSSYRYAGARGDLVWRRCLCSGLDV
ncbi:hypothetical protein EVAR_77525_1 [Eumeta japonica]|uniref:Uncharacterized protein n=1 Tax=Eumeta variegata TaxID=151549 RepID=A0A4C1T960_EUMVA|nr:hypothetical protein EVAR_77525_1 [Eumeta japonica]